MFTHQRAILEIELHKGIFMNLRILGLLIGLIVGVSGCNPVTYAPNRGTAQNYDEQLDTLNKNQRYIINEPLAPLDSQSTMGRFNARIIFLADQIERNSDRKSLANTVIVTSFTNLNKISQTSGFGRLVAESLMHELQVRKWQVYEIRLSNNIVVNESGEFSLSRDISKLKEMYKIGGIVTGTYSVVDGNLIVNARVIDMNTGIMISSAQSYMPANWFTDSLLYDSENMKTMKIMGSQ